VLYHLAERGIEWELLPWLAEHRIPVMAYSPFAQGALLRHRALAAVARDIGASVAQVALAWLLRRPDVIAIPQSADPAHVRDIAGALALDLPRAALTRLDAAFAPPSGPQPLRML
jgi:diketogulonate reductase-like aldo/keto reductase